MKKATEVDILRREFQMLQEDLKTHKDHQARITCAAQRLGRAIQLLAKPASHSDNRSLK